ncbi:MAG: hypothetical protein AABZ12_09500 [Planctomycetota bacterium]
MDEPGEGLVTMVGKSRAGWLAVAHLRRAGAHRVVGLALLVGGASLTPRIAEGQCSVPDNGGGTVTLPPAGCDYLSPQDVHRIIDGLPAGTTIELAPIHRDFICRAGTPGGGICSFQTLVDCDEPGGSLGGEKECRDSTLSLDLKGTGALAGWVRPMQIPVSFETHTAPRMPGDPVQSFDTDLFRLFGEINNIGDPDFDLLRIAGGTDFGMPSPGHTTLARLPGGNWAVDSFFDITYRIDFVGAPGGPVAGLTGSTTATIRMRTVTDPQACCLPLGRCAVLPLADCTLQGGMPLGVTATCAGDADGDGIDEACYTPPCGECPLTPPPVAHWIDQTPCPPGGTGQDNLPSGALVGIDLNFDCVADTSMVLGGPVTIRKRGPVDDATFYPGTRPIDGHLDVIDTEIVAMSLTGGGMILKAGTMSGSAQALTPTKGTVAEQTGNPALADSFFDVFVELDLGGGVYAYNWAAIRVTDVVECLPPDGKYIHIAGCTPLYSSPVVGVAAIHMANLVAANHFTYPGCCAPGLTPNGCAAMPVDQCQAIGGTPVPSCLGDLDGNGQDDACEAKCEVDPTSPTGCTDFCPPGLPAPAQCLPSSYGCNPNQQGTCGVLDCDCMCHLEFGAAGPFCTGGCPGTADLCQLRGNGGIGNPYVCECGPPCHADSAVNACVGPCPVAGESCIKKCVTVDAAGNAVVSDCQCTNNPDECHVVTAAAGIVAGGVNGCVVPDNGGTVTLPPAGCDYLSPQDVHRIIDGLPAGTTIELAPIHRDFICRKQQPAPGVCSFSTLVDCDEAGGSLGGEKECAESTLVLDLNGTGALAGWVRQISVPMSFETHTAPRMPGDPVQSFDTDMFRLFGEINNIGDPDFDLLRIVAGTDFGLPSPGHTTLTRLPGGGSWAVDSFFDITYRIDFVGAPGGPLAGRSGSTTATIRMATTPPFACKGVCPVGWTCAETMTQNTDGTMTVCCDCQAPLGACCLADGTCSQTTQAACQGSWNAGQTCSGSIEACCINGATGPICAMMDRTCCIASGGTPKGAGTVCGFDANGNGVDDACDEPCRADPAVNACVGSCPGAGESCIKKCAIYDPLTGQTTVSDCACTTNPDECHMVTFGAGVVAGGPNGCIVPDNGGGTVTLPPAGCDYLSPDDVHRIIDGLPAGTTIELAPIHRDFICHRQEPGTGVCSFSTLVDCDEPGDTPGSEKECAESTLVLDLKGTGTLNGWVRQLSVPMSFETHTDPRMPGDPVQSFDTDMFRMFGQLPPGDPDFDLLRITGGTDFGMPSPGHTTLTRLPGGGSWAVDSFFDITYRIDFVGAPGGPLAGRSGSTTATIRMATTPPFACKGACPVGSTCVETSTVNADGTLTVCCDCQAPLGACCLADGTCSQTTQAACTGSWLVGQVCSGSIEACCINGVAGPICAPMDTTCCIASGGTPQGVGSTCSTATQACCVPTATGGTACFDVDPICCDDIGGTSQGAGTLCGIDANGNGVDDACEQPCGVDPLANDCLGTCPNPATEKCVKKCARVTASGVIEAIDCNCQDPNQCHMEFGAAAQVVAVGPPPCVQPDAGGTVTLPPAGCPYVSPEDAHMIIAGLPVPTTIVVGIEHSRFGLTGSGAGGNLGGEFEQFNSSLLLNMQGTNTLAGFTRTKKLTADCETHIGARMPGDPVQSFDTDMFRMQAQIGDPDFDLLRIVAGTGFGMPSPGHTTLTRLPSGNWAVDSFFDITYRIDFVGAPGGPLAGMSGSTTGTIRMKTNAPFSCVGDCPTGMKCVESSTPNTDGSSTICCDCINVPPPACSLPSPTHICAPRQASDCQTTVTGELCLAKVVMVNTAGQPFAELCDCFVDNGMCGPVTVIPDAVGAMLSCDAACPNAGQECHVFRNGVATSLVQIHSTQVAQGEVITCDCVTPPQECQPAADGQSCVGSCPGSTAPCVPTFVQCTPGQNPPCKITHCDCQDTCHVALPAVGSEGPVCTGPCLEPVPPNRKCVRRFVDTNADQVKDSWMCRCVPVHPAPTPLSGVPNANRYVTFSVPSDGGIVAATEGTPQVAVRVKMDSLHHPDPPNIPCCPAPDFTAWEGGYRWAGPIVEYNYTVLPPTSFYGSQLRCDPTFADYPGAGAFSIYAPEVMPDSQYSIQIVDIACADSLDEEDCYSDPLLGGTQRWGDTVSTFQNDIFPVPAFPSQPNVLDVAAIVDHIKGIPGAVGKTRAQLQPNGPAPGANVNVLDLAYDVDALKNKAYPFAGPCTCPSGVACNPTAACSNDSGCSSPRRCVNGFCSLVDDCGRCAP